VPGNDTSAMEQLTHQPEIRGICDLQDGNAVDHVLLVRNRELRQTRAGADFMRLSLADRTGVVTGLIWDDVATASATAHVGNAVQITGTFSAHPRHGPQVTVQTLHIPHQVDWERLLEGPGTPIRELERRLDALLTSIEDRHLRSLMHALLGADSASGLAFRQAFAA